MADDILDADARQCILADIGKRFLDEFPRVGDGGGGTAADDLLDANQERSWGALNIRSVHYVVQCLGRNVALFVKVGLNGRKFRVAILADERVVVDAEHEDILGNSKIVLSAVGDGVVPTVVVRGKNTNGLSKMGDFLWSLQFVAPQSVVTQRFPKGPKAADAPFNDKGVMDEGIGTASPGGQQMARRRLANLIR